MKHRDLGLITVVLTAAGVVIALAAFVNDIVSTGKKADSIEPSSSLVQNQTTRGACSPAINSIQGGLDVSCNPAASAGGDQPERQKNSFGPTHNEKEGQTTYGVGSPAISNVTGNVKIRVGQP